MIQITLQPQCIISGSVRDAKSSSEGRATWCLAILTGGKRIRHMVFYLSLDVLREAEEHSTAERQRCFRGTMPIYLACAV